MCFGGGGGGGGYSRKEETSVDAPPQQNAALVLPRLPFTYRTINPPGPTHNDLTSEIKATETNENGGLTNPSILARGCNSSTDKTS